MFDCLIQRATIYDGTGRAPFPGDIAMQGDRIAAVGDLHGAQAAETVDATGLCAAPGFIDVHSHSDAYLLIQPGAESKIRQGVTTEIIGNCGASAAPILPGYTMPSDWMQHIPAPDWSSLTEYRAKLTHATPAVNCAMLIGHRTLRAAVMGTAPRPATQKEIEQMCALLERSMAEGAKGFSTGLIYAPAMFAEPAEIHALAATAAKQGGIYASHMRSEGDGLLEAIGEMLAVGRQTGIRLEISHLKTAGKANWAKLDAALALIHQAQAEGVDVAADRYPYTASSTDLDAILPVWAGQDGRTAILARLRNAATRERIRSELLDSHEEDYWQTIQIGVTHAPENRAHAGRLLADIAKDWQIHPVDAALRLMDTDELYTGGIFFGMSEANMWRILAEPYVMLGSDASLRAPWGPLSTDHPHPRAYGTFPRFLRAAFDGKTVPPAEAIRKMTSLPAAHFRLKDRGVLHPGAFADVVLFHSATVRDTATYATPHQFAEGIQHVRVNGKCAFAADETAVCTPAGRYLA